MNNSADMININLSCTYHCNGFDIFVHILCSITVDDDLLFPDTLIKTLRNWWEKCSLIHDGLVILVQ